MDVTLKELTHALVGLASGIFISYFLVRYMDVFTHGVVLVGIFALLLFTPRRSGCPAGPVEGAGSRVLFIPVSLAFAISYLWWFLVGERLPLIVG